MPLIAAMDVTQSPAVCQWLVSYGSGEIVPDFMVAPNYLDVSGVVPQPLIGWTFDGSAWVQPASQINQGALLAKARGALNANLTYLAIGSPTTAQAVAQVAALTRQLDALARILLDQFDSMTGT